MESRWLPALQMRTVGEGSHRTTWRVDKASPWFEGHFPSKPILPGLGLLALVLHGARTGLQRDGLRLARVIKTRFKGVILPGDELDFSLDTSPLDPGEVEVQVRFQVERNGDEVCAGRLVVTDGE